MGSRLRRPCRAYPILTLRLRRRREEKSSLSRDLYLSSISPVCLRSRPSREQMVRCEGLRSLSAYILKTGVKIFVVRGS